MKGGKSLVDRGMTPRLLSGIFRKGRAVAKSTNGDTSVTVSMSYYEIYNDRVYDLFESPDKRTATGLPIREAEGGKTVVVGLTEVLCEGLKGFETLYDRANSNRSTGATKLNSQSSRSHAILCVKLVVSTPTETRISTVSAIDLAGSEDNRRTGNVKERMVESASINKSLFVLAQCVEAIGKKQQRIPYRESKMTRILSLGQNNGFTVMILNLAPVQSYHLDTLSSLNFANRTKKIEVREVENEPIFKGPPRQPAGMTSITGSSIQRQPLRPLTNAANINLAAQKSDKPGEKPLKAFSVYSDRNSSHRPFQNSNKSPLKRTADSSFLASTRPNKMVRPTPCFIRRGPEPHTLTKQSIESLVEKKVSEILASRAQDASQQSNATSAISEEVQRRLNSIEDRLAGQEGERAEGLSYLLMAKQHQARGEDSSALKMYEVARPYFPENEKLAKKIENLRERIQGRREEHPALTQRRYSDPLRTDPYPPKGLTTKKSIAKMKKTPPTTPKMTTKPMTPTIRTPQNPPVTPPNVEPSQPNRTRSSASKKVPVGHHLPIHSTSDPPPRHHHISPLPQSRHAPADSLTCSRPVTPISSDLCRESGPNGLRLLSTR